jgi:bifunctional UDP-N-acetylglucosamine pyrophosphorylase/glucosamine-1-phosphate N-acetyltransferase
MLCIRASLLVPALRRVLRPSWLSGTPIVEIAGVLDELGHDVMVMPRSEALEPITSIASRTPIEMKLRDRITTSWIHRGVNMPDPRQVSIDATVELGQGVTILPGSVLQGATVVADGATIGPNSHLINATIGSSAEVPHSVVNGVELDAHEQVAPFSVLGAGSR